MAVTEGRASHKMPTAAHPQAHSEAPCAAVAAPEQDFKKSVQPTESPAKLQLALLTF